MFKFIFWQLEWRTAKIELIKRGWSLFYITSCQEMSGLHGKICSWKGGCVCSLERNEGSMCWFKVNCVFDEREQRRGRWDQYVRDAEHVLATLPIWTAPETFLRSLMLIWFPSKKKFRKIMDSCLFCYVEEDQKRFPSMDIPSKPEHLAEGHKNIGSWKCFFYVVFNINLRFPYTLQGPKPPKWIDFALDEDLLICRTRFSFSFYMAGRKRPTITNRKLEAAGDLAT